MLNADAITFWNGEVGDQVIAATELKLIGTAATGEGVVGIAADEAVGAVVAGKCVGEGVARGVDVAGAVRVRFSTLAGAV